MSNPYQVVRDFEKAVCDYTGAPYCVAVTSCTDALKLAVGWHLRGRSACRYCGLTEKALQQAGGHLCDRSPCGWQDIRPIDVDIPKRTYVGVGMAILNAGGRVTFRDEEWSGAYQLAPLPVIDSARWFTGGMYDWMSEKIIGHGAGKAIVGRGFVAVSFHASKILADTQGGAILHDNPEADKWLRRARFDGRTEGVAPKDDTFDMLGHHCLMSPDVAARLLWKLSVLPKHNDPLPWGPGTNSDYPDLSSAPIFQ